jgi:hypothetical protein
MRLRFHAPAYAAVLAFLLAGCGADEPRSASDPTPTAGPTEASPYPGFDPTDYTYVLVTTCFCPDAGTPIAITVVDDEVAHAVLAADGTGRGGGEKGDPAPDYLRRTIDDVIDAANAAVADGAVRVDVRWPEGQDHPDSVVVEGREDVADDGVGYAISEVRVT